MMKITPSANQYKAIETTEGPVLIIAGPGTGKTFTLVERILHIIKSNKAQPNEILIITFTKKAAKELMTRISNRFSDEGINNINLDDMYISTFHSFSERLIKENPERCRWFSKNHSIIDEFEQLRFISRYINMRTIVKDNGQKYYDVIDFCGIKDSREVIANHLRDIDYTYRGGFIKKRQAAKVICSLCDSLIEALVDPEFLMKQNDVCLYALGKILVKYQELLEKNDYIVFSTVQLYAYKMLIEDKDGGLKNKFKYVMVDEYQDTNRIQERLVDILSGEKKNICVVGDDDQSLYRFRGATVENILNFENKYSEFHCQKTELNENYRSDNKIVSFYTNWIKNPQGFTWKSCRLDKSLSTNKIAQTQTVIRIGKNDEEDWCRAIYSFIKKLKDSGKITDYNQVAFLCKSVKNKSIINLQNYLQENGISVYSPRSQMFFKRLEVQQALGCLLLMFPDVKNSINNVKEDYKRYCDNVVKEAEKIVFENKGLESFILSIAQNKDCLLTLKEILYQLFAFQPFLGYLDVDIDGNMEEVRPSRNLSLLINKCGLAIKGQLNLGRKTYKQADFFFKTFLYSQYQDGVNEYEDEKKYAPEGYMSFMTIHQSKGLEFPVVIVDSLSNCAEKRKDLSFINTVIQTQYPNPFEPNEDTPLFDFYREYYTAFSRAQNLLVLTCRNEPSQLFKSVWNCIPELEEAELDLSKINFNKVKSAEFKDSFSYTSDIIPYETCPKKYKFRKILKFEGTSQDTPGTMFGTLVHQTLQDIHLEAIKNEEITIEKINEWFDKNAKSLQRAKKINLNPILENARNNVINYYDYLNKGYSDKNRWTTIKASEMKVSLAMKDYIIKGTIDMVRDYPEFYRIFDFKTGQCEENMLQSYYRQLRIYAYLLGCITEEKEVTMQLFFTGEKGNHIRTLRYDNEKENITKEIEQFSNTVAKIMKHEFSKMCSNDKICSKCDFKYICKNIKQLEN